MCCGLGVRGKSALDTEIEFDTDINIACHLDDFGEVDSLFSGFLQIGDGKDLETRVVDLLRSEY
jgi:hypothetical protein